MNLIPERAKWQWVRRIQYANRIKGFWAHWDTYASPECQFSAYNKIYRGAFLGRSKLGRFTYVTNGTVYNSTIGSFCSIGPNAIIGLGYHPTDLLSTHPAFYSKNKTAGITFASEDKYPLQPKVMIGNDVWIGAGALIRSGLKIGDGAVVGAGAVVTRDVKPFSVVAGVPAKLIRYRFSDDVIQELQSWNWWDLSVDILQLLVDDFSARNDWTVEKIKRLKDASLT